MVFARTYRTEAEFQAAWPEMLNALQRLHENDLVLPDYRFELAEPELRQVRASARVNVEKALRKFWQFDERFFGNTARDGVACFRWSVYSLAYLAADHRVANDLLSVFVPVLGPYAVKEFGLLFARKVSATFRDEVEQLIWDIQEAEEPGPGEFFNWRGHLNDWPDEMRVALLDRAGLPPLKDVDIPPADVMREFCPAPHHARPTRTYRRDLRKFYDRQY